MRNSLYMYIRSKTIDKRKLKYKKNRHVASFIRKIIETIAIVRMCAIVHNKPF